ncbi:unnamed protein product, partial [Pelagomonas calceolata]
AEHGSRVSQASPKPFCGRVRAAHHAPRNTFSVLERRYGFANIVERGVGVFVESLREKPPIVRRSA